MRISEDVAEKFVSELSALDSLKSTSISYELQDEWQFILILVKVSSLENREDIVEFLRAAQEMAEMKFPWRVDEYSWMVNIVKGNLVVESVFGGDLNSPASGRI